MYKAPVFPCIAGDARVLWRLWLSVKLLLTKDDPITGWKFIDFYVNLCQSHDKVNILRLRCVCQSNILVDDYHWNHSCKSSRTALTKLVFLFTILCSFNLVRYHAKLNKTVNILSTQHKGNRTQVDGKKKPESLLCCNNNMALTYLTVCAVKCLWKLVVEDALCQTSTIFWILLQSTHGKLY